MTKVDIGNLEQLLDTLNHAHIETESASSEELETPFPILPQEFLRFAEADLESELAHRNINALANTKRALDCQIACVLATFGLDKIAQQEFWGVPKKLEVVRELGIKAPRIFDKINRMRNRLEHEFEDPDLETVTDALDTVKIFIAYTDNVFRHFQSGLIFLVGDNSDDTDAQELGLQFDIGKKVLVITHRNALPTPKDIHNINDLYDSVALEPENALFLGFLERLINIRF